MTQFSDKRIQKLPQFKDGPTKSHESQKEFEAIALVERLKKERREHLKQKYIALYNDYDCDSMRSDTTFPFRGMSILKLLARKEEEFSDASQNYMSSHS